MKFAIGIPPVDAVFEGIVVTKMDDQVNKILSWCLASDELCERILENNYSDLPEPPSLIRCWPECCKHYTDSIENLREIIVQKMYEKNPTLKLSQL